MAEEVERRRERFVEAGGVLPRSAADRALLEAILASGDFLPELLGAEPAGFAALAADPWLRRYKPAAIMAREVRAAVAGADGLRELQCRLRRVRRAEMLRMGARELGWGTTEEVARELSALADACLEAAVAICDAELARELGEPREESGARARFVVMAMGKLGGEELNFSSDIDVCYFYSSDAGEAALPGREPRSLHHYHAELSRRVSAAIEEATEDGTVFRVDLRLRPEGRNGPVCNSLAAAESYYETFGRTWERQAWLRARPAAGDLALGEELLDILGPFIYRRHVDAALVEEVRGLRALFRDPADAGDAFGDAGFDVKLGSGGIRDVEMVVQALQLLHAGKRPELRERNTPKALPRLVVAGLLGDREAWTLLSAYRFWRRLEHRVQVATGAQRHRLPGDDADRARFAEGLGFASLAAFDAEVAAKRAAVEAIAATLGAPADSSKLEAARPDSASRPPPPTRWSCWGRGCRLVSWKRRSRRPTRIARSCTSAISCGAGRARCSRCCATSRSYCECWRRCSGPATGSPICWCLIRRPGTHSWAASASRPDRWRSWARSRRASSPAIRTRRPSSERCAGCRQETLRIGMHDVAGALEAGAVSRQLTDLAEVCLAASVEAVKPSLVARWGQPRTGLTVLGLGSLGAHEMRYGSDLDLVFLYGADGETATGVDHREWAARASQRLIAAMETMLEEGRLYQVDTRLRPSGEQGLLVTSWSAFERYHAEDAASWERVALLRARIVYSDEPADTQAARRELLAAIAFDRRVDQAKFRADLRAMRGRVEQERGRVPAGSRHLRFDPGGIMDLEFLVALGQLQHPADPGVRTTGTAVALARLCELGWPTTLAEDHAFLRRVALRLRLLLDRPEDVVSPRDLPILARSLGVDTNALAAEIDERMARVRARFDET